MSEKEKKKKKKPFAVHATHDELVFADRRRRGEKKKKPSKRKRAKKKAFVCISHTFRIFPQSLFSSVS